MATLSKIAVGAASHTDFGSKGQKNRTENFPNCMSNFAKIADQVS
jgi:hypothetical protein